MSITTDRGLMIDLVDHAHVGGVQQVVLGLEVVLDRPDRDARLLGHGADAHGLKAAVDHEPHERVGELLRGDGGRSGHGGRL